MTTAYRFAVNVTPKPGILDPQGRAVEGSLAHLGIEGVSGVRVGRRVELTVAAADEGAARATAERLAGELLSNPLIEAFGIELLQATSSTTSVGAAAAPSSTAGGPSAGPSEPARAATGDGT
jgi:phosphoribosylformylglycinamidine synthase PurS subunit